MIGSGSGKLTIKRYKEKLKGHTKTVIDHKKEVYKCMKDCGHPIQGLLHDMSKFSPIEFFESVKYFTGTRSPIENAKEVKGYSDAWLHHKGKNKHHSQYWIDNSWGKTTPQEIPWKYLLELICDGIGAGKVYSKNRGETWSQETPLKYWYDRDQTSYYHPNTRKKLEWYYSQIATYGWEYVADRIKHQGDYYKINK